VTDILPEGGRTFLGCESRVNYPVVDEGIGALLTPRLSSRSPCGMPYAIGSDKNSSAARRSKQDRVCIHTNAAILGECPMMIVGAPRAVVQSLDVVKTLCRVVSRSSVSLIN
jgi:hypothetical protein